LLVVVVVDHHLNHQASHPVELVELVLFSLLLIPTMMVALIKVNSKVSLVKALEEELVVHHHMNTAHHRLHIKTSK
jgi:hypothetical protein